MFCIWILDFIAFLCLINEFLLLVNIACKFECFFECALLWKRKPFKCFKVWWFVTMRLHPSLILQNIERLSVCIWLREWEFQMTAPVWVTSDSEERDIGKGVEQKKGGKEMEQPSVWWRERTCTVSSTPARSGRCLYRCKHLKVIVSDCIKGSMRYFANKGLQSEVATSVWSNWVTVGADDYLLFIRISGMVSVLRPSCTSGLPDESSYHDI